MIVVADASPLMNLAGIGQLDLLRQLYGRVLVPAAVYREVVLVGHGQPGAAEVAAADWVEVRACTTRAMPERLDEGEAEAISLALEVQADLLLVDERRGREAATKLGVPILGLLGVLLAAKDAGLVASLAPLLTRLRTEAGFWLGRELIERALRQAGEM